MKQQLLTSAAIVALVAATPALAAPPPPPIYNWTGFYVGGNVGYSWGNSDGNFTDPGFINGFGNFDGEGRTGLPGIFRTTTKPDGLIGGAQVGYNWQINSMGLIGVEADWQKSAEKANAAFNSNYTCDFEGAFQCALSQTRQASIDWFRYGARSRGCVLINPTTSLFMERPASRSARCPRVRYVQRRHQQYRHQLRLRDIANQCGLCRRHRHRRRLREFEMDLEGRVSLRRPRLPQGQRAEPDHRKYLHLGREVLR